MSTTSCTQEALKTLTMIVTSTHPTSRDRFNAARRRAFVQDLLAEISGKSSDLLSFDQVKEQLDLAPAPEPVETKAIPLNRIVGSVGRYRDFNRAFLPRDPIDPERWTRIERLQFKGPLPPIEVFQVGEVYFVHDGNHRVSVARSRDQKMIMAHVVNMPIRVPLSVDTSPQDLVLKAGYTEFLKKTGLDQTCPDQIIELTRLGAYLNLFQHIEVHQFYMGLRSRHYPTIREAAKDWYNRVYLPAVLKIRESGILYDFPGRTEADLYLWIAENQAQLQMQKDSHAIQGAVEEFATQHHPFWPFGWLRRLFRTLRSRLTSHIP